MELVISEFLISHQLILSVIHQSKLSIESSKGIYSIHLFPFHHITTCIITSDFPTTNQLNKFSKNTNLGDIIAVLGSIDFVLGSVDGLFLHSYLYIVGLILLSTNYIIYSILNISYCSSNQL